jgi:hypothetical protein
MASISPSSNSTNCQLNFITLKKGQSLLVTASVISCSTQTVHYILDLFRETNDVMSEEEVVVRIR